MQCLYILIDLTFSLIVKKKYIYTPEVEFKKLIEEKKIEVEYI